MDWADGIAETARAYSGTAFSLVEAAVLEREKRCTWVDRLWFRKIAERVTRKTGVGKVLDVGCGNGLLLR
jgi:2-polyprenyl-3-methyl-5-hydroxy-6-metoxy-1,4-benzoquinol methylase